MTTHRFPRSVYQRGHEPDARFSLANERTFLAWIGASLALLSVGTGLESFAVGLHPGYRLAASLALILAGVSCAVQSWIGWTRTERALRHDQPLPSSVMIATLPPFLVLAAILIVLGLVLP